MTGVEGDREVRYNLGESEQPDRERIAGELVDLPADDDELDLRRHHHRQQTHYEPPEGRDAEHRIRVVCRRDG